MDEQTLRSRDALRIAWGISRNEFATKRVFFLLALASTRPAYLIRV
jgi:hypothetical protein